MSSVVIAGNTSGSVTLAAPDVAGSTTLNLPTVSGGTLVTSDSSGNVGIGTNTAGGKFSVVTGSSAANSVTSWANYAVFGANAASSTGAGIGLSYNTSADQAELIAIAPNVAWKPLVLLGGGIRFNANNGGESMRIDTSGNVLVGTTNTDPTFNRVNGTNIKAGGGILTRQSAGGSDWGINSTSGIAITFYTDNGSARVTAGNISSNGSTTSYNASSDYRMKENIQPMVGALDTVAQLKPVTYNWKDEFAGTNKQGQGFIAHELAEVVPDCVTGEKDAVDEEGNPIYQGIDTSFLVATLTAAIQELKAELDTVKTELAALKGTA